MKEGYSLRPDTPLLPIIEPGLSPLRQALFEVAGMPPFCKEEGCEFCVCIWANTDYCYRHSMDRLGESEMKRLYESTHDLTWEQFHEDI